MDEMIKTLLEGFVKLVADELERRQQSKLPFPNESFLGSDEFSNAVKDLIEIKYESNSFESAVKDIVEKAIEDTDFDDIVEEGMRNSHYFDCMVKEAVENLTFSVEVS